MSGGLFVSFYLVKFLLEMARKLLNLLRNIPYATDAIQAGTLMATGDIIAQSFVEKRTFSDIDTKRTGRFFLIGTFCVGPPLRLWYGVLHKHITGGSKVIALKKVMLDQLLFAPFFMGIILSIINFSQGDSSATIVKKLERDYPDILKNNYKVWPAVQLLNFYLIPLRFQVATVQTVAVFWNTYLSWKTNKPGDIADELARAAGIS